MLNIENVSELRQQLADEPSVVLVPTMGNLHAGHLELVKIARSQGKCIVVSIFVNRLQFGPNEDFGRYPRTLASDCEQLEKLGVDVAFVPDEKELYPELQRYFVQPSEVGDQLEGAFRPGFFRGVSTVVLKLFNIVRPQIAVFGKKDYQQLHIVREMVRQFNLPIEIIAGETVRAPDGLALSSRNQYLSVGERAEAVRMYSQLRRIKESIENGSKEYDSLIREAEKDLDTHGWKVDYVALRHRWTLAPAARGDKELIVLGAARLGTTRLIDNLEVCLPEKVVL